MLNWDLAYDYAAIYLLLIIIIWYFHEKRIPLASHRTFLVALAAVFVSTGLEIVSTKLAQMFGKKQCHSKSNPNCKKPTDVVKARLFRNKKFSNGWFHLSKVCAIISFWRLFLTGAQICKGQARRYKR